MSTEQNAPSSQPVTTQPTGNSSNAPAPVGSALRPYTGGAKRNELQKCVDRKLIEDWTLEGKGYEAIAELLNARPNWPYTLSSRTVWKDVLFLRKKWIAETTAERSEWVSRELKTLNKVEAELWDAWRRSREALTKEMGKFGAPEVDGGKAKLKEKKLTKEIQVGDAYYLKLILDVQERRAKLIGLDAPTKMESKSTTDITVRYENMTEAELDATIKNRVDFVRRVAPESLAGVDGEHTTTA